MTSREILQRAIRFGSPERLPIDLPEPHGTDFARVRIKPSPDDRPSQGIDEWGAVWENIGVCQLGEVKEFPLKDWADFDRMVIPDIHDPRRWGELEGARQRAGEKFLLAGGLSIYERVHFIRGLENTWMDIYDAPEQLSRLIDVLVEMNLVAIGMFAAAGADGYLFCDDWGCRTA